MSSIPQALGRSVIVALDRDCAVGGTTAALLRARHGHLLHEEAFILAGLSRTDLGALRRVLADFARRGWCEPEGGIWRSRGGAIPEGLPDFLAGATAMREFGRPETEAEPVVTLPTRPSRVAEALPETGLSYVRLVDTESAFHRLARSAARSFSILSPFLNDEGVEWALSLFRQTPAPERKLVIRRFDNVQAYLTPRREEFARLGVKVFDYYLVAPGDDGYETFHAKIVMADEERVYVGSANLLVYERRSVELGFLVRGAAARPVAGLVSAVTRISRPVLL